jgi:hypothetical protein
METILIIAYGIFSVMAIVSGVRRDIANAKQNLNK